LVMAIPFSGQGRYGTFFQAYNQTALVEVYNFDLK
jgi:hypothetical protein